MGNLNTKWLREFHRSACGVEPKLSGSIKDEESLPVRILFPSKKTIEESKSGPNVSDMIAGYVEGMTYFGPSDCIGSGNNYIR